MARHFVSVLIDIKMPDSVPSGEGTATPNGGQYIRDIVQAGATVQGYTATETQPYSHSLLALGSLLFRIS